MNKEENRMRYKNPNLWFRVMKRKYKEDWEHIMNWLEHETNTSCMIKTACILWWDCFEEGEDYDWSAVKYHVDRYNRSMESEYTKEQLINCLTILGFPKKIATVRAYPPKCQTKG